MRTDCRTPYLSQAHDAEYPREMQYPLSRRYLNAVEVKATSRGLAIGLRHRGVAPSAVHSKIRAETER
jgi:hypothetical protein